MRMRRTTPGGEDGLAGTITPGLITAQIHEGTMAISLCRQCDLPLTGPTMTQPPLTPFDGQPLRAKVIQVTGGAQGIGRGIAQAVLGAGDKVTIGDLDAEAGKACLTAA
jgi:hypothetical protein